LVKTSSTTFCFSQVRPRSSLLTIGKGLWGVFQQNREAEELDEWSRKVVLQGCMRPLVLTVKANARLARPP
jgi:hypothetical protein